MESWAPVWTLERQKKKSATLFLERAPGVQGEQKAHWFLQAWLAQFPGQYPAFDIQWEGPWSLDFQQSCSSSVTSKWEVPTYEMFLIRSSPSISVCLPVQQWQGGRVKQIARCRLVPKNNLRSRKQDLWKHWVHSLEKRKDWRLS